MAKQLFVVSTLRVALTCLMQVTFTIDSFVLMLMQFVYTIDSFVLSKDLTYREVEFK